MANDPSGPCAPDADHAGVPSQPKKRPITPIPVSDLWRDALLASTDLVCIVTDASGRVHLFNTGAECQLGFASREVLHQPILAASPQHGPAPDGPCLDAPTMLALQSAAALQPVSCRCKDGKSLTLDLTVLSLGDPHSDHHGYLLLGTHRDADQIGHDRRFERLLECAPDPIVVVNQAGLIVTTNIQAAALFGWRRAELIGHPVEVLIPARHRGKHAAERSHYFADPKIRAMGTGMDLFGLRKNGKEFPIDVSLNWLEFGGERLVICAVRDVSERQLAEQRFRDLLEVAPDALFIVNRQGKIELVNAEAIKLFGWSRAEMVGQSIERLIPERYKAGNTDLHSAFFTGPLTRAGGAGLELAGLRKDGSEFPMEVKLNPLKADDKTIVIASVRDVTEWVKANERLHYIAHYDSLTGLPNRTSFAEQVNQALALAQRHGLQCAIVLVDLDHFKNINDTLGHAAGDHLLAQFARRLLLCVRARDIVGRFGSDEFALLLLARDAHTAASEVAAKIHTALDQHFDLDGNEVGMRASIGIAVHPSDAPDLASLLKFADTAMHHAKQAGRDTWRFFTPQMNAEALARHTLEMALRKALARDEFELHYQPKVLLQSGRVIGLEALLRWNSPSHGTVAPAVFVPILEQTGLITQVGGWVLRTVCRQIAQWLKGAVGPVSVAVNISERQFSDHALGDELNIALNEHGLPPDLLELELTESTLMHDTAHTIDTLRMLRHRGVHVSIDDFGTGYSSLAYLRRFPIDKLKIDMTFIREVTSNPDDAAIVQAIIQLAHSLKLDVIAEGVETEAQLAYLRRLRCDQIQGFLFSRPLSTAETERLLTSQRHLQVASPVPRGRQNTLLLVDDEENVLRALKRLLRQDGYHILAAHSANEAFELLALHPVQVILCDQRMPVMNGTTFLSKVKELYPDTVRIILSGYTDLESILQAINHGAIYRFHTKPWENTALRKEMQEVSRHYWMLHDAKQASGARP